MTGWKRGRNAGVWVPLAVGATWAGTAALLGGGGPAGIGMLRVLGVFAGAAAIGVVACKRGAMVGAAGLAALSLTVAVGYFLSIRPSHDRAWTRDQSRLPRVERAGDRVTVLDTRAFRYRSPEDYDAAWVDRTIDLGDLQGVDFAVERFTDNEAVAHTLVSFRFDHDDPLVISVEIRKEIGESFGPLKGLFRQFELMYVIGDERDLIELRAVHRADDVYLHPMRATPQQARAFFLSLLDGAQSVWEQPQFYNTVSASCTTVLAQHLQQVADVGLDYRVWLPGYSDALAFDLGLIDTDADFATTRSRHHINARARAAAGTDAFSQRIRAAH